MEADPAPDRAAQFELLRALARAELDAPAVDRLATAAAWSIDWTGLPGLLARHGLTVFAARHLWHVRDRVPVAVWDAVQAQATGVRGTSLAMTAELFRILETFDARKIAVLPFKGPVLAWRAYQDLGARPFTDLDLVVHPREVGAAGAALVALGYAPEYELSGARDAWFRRVDGDYPFVHPVTGHLVELHARVASRRFGGAPATDVLWVRRETLTIAGRPVAVLGADDAFLVQALHGGKHRWERLEWVAAVAELLRQRGGDVTSVIAGAGAAERAVLLACAVAADWLGAPLVEEVEARRRRDPVVAVLAAAAWRHVLGGATDGGPGETSAKLRFNWRLQCGIMARARFAYRWAMWPSPEDWEAVRLPDRFFFAYRVVRPIRLLIRYGGRWLRNDSRSGI
ncbi:MAG: nucleotidyltransferase family protein [Gemmatimonadaceae bacterium]